ncbi:MAG: hypothetical protein ABIV21_02525 [Pyrinomonadaceae bacterium]
MKKVKPKPPSVFCLFHEESDCPCIYPVTTTGKLKIRLQNAINLGKWDARFAAKSDEYKARLKALFL